MLPPFRAISAGSVAVTGPEIVVLSVVVNVAFEPTPTGPLTITSLNWQVAPAGTTSGPATVWLASVVVHGVVAAAETAERR